MEAFINPISITCEEILSQSVGYTLQFTKREYSYLVEMPAAADNFNDRHVEKITSALTLSEIDGAEDGIFTWLLFDFGPGTLKQVIVKQIINITEIRTKHIDILKDVCVGYHSVDRNPMDSQSIIRIYFGGELQKITEQIKGKQGKERKEEKEKSFPHITYNVNFLSGSFSVDQIDPTTFSREIEEELKDIFITGICSQDQVCRSNHLINILRTNQTMISRPSESIEDFDRVMLDSYGRAGASIYKFGPDPESIEMYKRSKPIFRVTYNVRLQQLEQLRKSLEKMRVPMDERTYQDKLDEIMKPTTDEEISRFLLRGGKYKYNQHKQRKETKKNKKYNQHQHKQRKETKRRRFKNKNKHKTQTKNKK